MLPRNLSLILGVFVLLFSILPACSKSETTAETHANANTATAAGPSSSPVAPATVAGGQTPALPAPSRVVFIFDASGSMLGRVGQEEKMAVARRVMKESITKLPVERTVDFSR